MVKVGFAEKVVLNVQVRNESSVESLICKGSEFEYCVLVSLFPFFSSPI